MTEPTQRSFLVFLGKQVCGSESSGSSIVVKFIFWVSVMKKNYSYTLQLESPDASPSMKISALRTLSYTLKTLGEVRHDHLVIIFGFLVPLYTYIYRYTSVLFIWLCICYKCFSN
jgi:hypothetical protein